MFLEIQANELIVSLRMVYILYENMVNNWKTKSASKKLKFCG